jgi:hypothetical protein
MKGFRYPKMLLLVVMLSPFAAHAASGAYEINQDCVAVGCFAGDAAGYPVTITQPGTYVLTSDLAPPALSGVDAIDVQTTSVDLDLNGHTIDGGGTCPGEPVSCTPGNGAYGISAGSLVGAGAFHIHDGTVRGFGASSSNAISIFNAGDGTRLERLNVVENAAVPMSVYIASYHPMSMIRVQDSQFARNGGRGLDGGMATRMVISNNTFTGNQTQGINVPDASVIESNYFVANGSYGVTCNNRCALGHNTFDSNNNGGVQWNVPALLDRGGNTCFDHACP